MNCVYCEELVKISEVSRKIEINLSTWQLGSGLNKLKTIYIRNTVQLLKRTR